MINGFDKGIVDIFMKFADDKVAKASERKIKTQGDLAELQN